MRGSPVYYLLADCYITSAVLSAVWSLNNLTGVKTVSKRGISINDLWQTKGNVIFQNEITHQFLISLFCGSVSPVCCVR